MILVITHVHSMTIFKSGLIEISDDEPTNDGFKTPIAKPNSRTRLPPQTERFDRIDFSDSSPLRRPLTERKRENFLKGLLYEIIEHCHLKF